MSVCDERVIIYNPLIFCFASINSQLPNLLKATKSGFTGTTEKQELTY